MDIFLAAKPQLAFLESHPTVGVVGSGFATFCHPPLEDTPPNLKTGPGVHGPLNGDGSLRDGAVWTSTEGGTGVTKDTPMTVYSMPTHPVIAR
jgi:hypothetical protein